MKWYVVFVGRETGVFESWFQCKKRVHGFTGAIYKSFGSREIANDQFRKFNKNDGAKGKPSLRYAAPKVGICSDSSFSSKTKILEYRVVNISNGSVVHQKSFQCLEGEYLNNIGEYLALVRAIKHVVDNNLNVPIYCDSITAIAWVKKGVKTGIKNEVFSRFVEIAQAYINSIDLPIVSKWQTGNWGEIPADFGRK